MRVPSPAAGRITNTCITCGVYIGEAGNREQGTGNREQGIGSREEGPRGQGNEKLEGELVLSPVPKGEGPGAPALFSKNQFVRAV
jgi:hypothetical protein